MDGIVQKEKQDLTFLKWSHIRSSSGTAGTFLKSESSLNGVKTYYKLSNFDPVHGVTGHECINEIIVDRLLTLLGVDHLNYKLIHADVEIEGQPFSTWVCSSEDFKNRGESKAALDDFYRANAMPGESHYDFCVRYGWKDYADTMIAVDYIILNRDRHGANIEVLRNAQAHTLRIAPLFDHGISLLYPCSSDEEAANYPIMEDRRCNNFLGGSSCLENLKLLNGRKDLFQRRLSPADKKLLFEDLENALSPVFLDQIWNMLYGRYLVYETL